MAKILVHTEDKECTMFCYCSNCKNSVDFWEAYCKHCGAPLEHSTESRKLAKEVGKWDVGKAQKR